MTGTFKPALFLLLFFFCIPSFSQTNPFLSNGTSGEERPETAITEPGGPATWPVIGSLVTISAAVQRNLQQTIASSMNDLKSTGSISSLGVLLGISFVFGVLHAIGPGHRKAVLVTYFLGEGTKPVKGFMTGFLLALAHAASAIALVGGLYLFTTRSLLISVDKAQNLLFPITYAIILILGIWMIIHGILEYRTKHRREQSNGGIGGLILSGLVPCPAASAIMILAVAGNAIPIGILSVLMMSLGMGILLAIVGLLAVLMRNRIIVLLKNSKKTKAMELSLHLLSGLAMALFGLFMALGSL
ncbi:MAG: hypothetical protein K8S62_08025 [Candidatus Sabulitectum sp.]|nr:hypothetical protein [Candidatus Sabulitectum sp.]